MQGQGSLPNSPASPLDATGEALRRQGGSAQRQNLPESPYATPENGQQPDAPQRSSLEAWGEQQQAALAESRSAPPGQPLRGNPEGAKVSISLCPVPFYTEALQHWCKCCSKLRSRLSFQRQLV